MTRASSSAASRGLIVAILVVASHAGCGAQTPPFVFNSRREPASAPSSASVERLWVYADVQSEFFKDESYKGFQAGLMGRLTDCGIASRVSPTGPLDATDPARIEVVPGEPSPTSVMAISFVPSDSRIQKFFYQGVVTRISGVLYFKVGLFDAASHKLVWSAKASFEFPSHDVNVDDEIHGMQFASSLITTLQRDGVLDRCRVREPYPGCLQQRREVQLQASKTRDRYERVKLLQSAPTCK